MKISIVASISVDNIDEISKFVLKWSCYLNSSVDLIVCVNNLYGFKVENTFVKVVEFKDNRGMFKFNIQQKKYFAARHSLSDYVLFIHDRIIPSNILFFKSLIKYLEVQKPDYLTFLIKNLDGTDSLPMIYFDLDSILDGNFYSYLINLKNSRGCIFNDNNIPSINGAAFLLKNNHIGLLNNNFRWGEMEDLKLTFDLYVKKCNGKIYKQDYLLTKIYKAELKDISNRVLLIHYIIKLFYCPISIIFGFTTIYSKINYVKKIDMLNKKVPIKVIDILHKPFHTTIYDNSLEKILTIFRSLDDQIELKIEKKFWGYKISIDE